MTNEFRNTDPSYQEPTLTENSETVLKDRYLEKNEQGENIETPKDMFYRVAAATASAEIKYKGDEKKWRKKFYNLMASGEFMPNSPTLMNGGRNDNLLSACFVLPVEDSIDGIFDTVKDTAVIQKAGGGTGFSFDKLRPTGDYIKSSGGTTSGPISFWKVLSEATNAIQQGAFRRGANMGMMTITHPDILKFIHAKQDLTAFTNYNISVKIPELWMAAYESTPEGLHIVENFRNGKKFIVPREFKGKTQDNNPVDIMNYSLADLTPYVGGTEYKEGVYWTRKQVFDVIVDCAWRTGEPGLIFIDEINAHNPTPHIGEIEATNPCVTGDTPILTDKGFYPIGSLVGVETNIWNGEEWSPVTPSITGTDQKLLEVTFSDGTVLKCTPYHKFYLQNGAPRDNKPDIKVEAKDLESGHRLASWDHPVISGDEVVSTQDAYTMGFYCGDGSKETTRDRDAIWLYGVKKELVEKLTYKHANECGNDRIFLSLDKEKTWEKNFVPPVAWDVSSRMDWLAGLIDSDGSATKDGSVQIWSVDKDFLQRTKEMLFCSGTQSTLVIGKAACQKLMPDGKGGQKEYSCQETWRLLIPLWGVDVLKGNGLECHRVDISKESKQKNFAIKVVSVSALTEVADKVYCFTENKRHRGTFGCVGGGNCGEQPLLPHEACNLGSIDLVKFVEDGALNERRLRAVVRDSVRFLEDIIEINPYPIPAITKICTENRKIGLGLMGFADALFLMGIPYNSEEGVNAGRDIMKLVNDTAHKASGTIAGERGNFANYEGSIYEKQGVPMRNSATTTIAPTGTISIIADCSGGVEPLFSLAFIRNVMGKKLYEINKHFKKVALDRGFYSEAIMDRIIKEGTLAHIDEIPQDVKDLFVCTHDISPEWHVKMQAAFQEHCDSSISKTINFSEDATREDVIETYLMAWKTKCKGITVYRNNCRDFQPMALDDSDKEVEDEPASRGQEDYSTRRPIKTPDITSSVRIRQSTPFGHMHVHVSVDPTTGREVEVFAQLGKAGDVLASDLEAISRLASLYLRLGGDISDITSQLEDIGSTSVIPTRDGNVSSMADALSKALVKYRNAKNKGLEQLLTGQLSPADLHKKPSVADVLPEVVKAPLVRKKEKCLDCGAALAFVEGCAECSAQCGFSKCGG